MFNIRTDRGARRGLTRLGRQEPRTQELIDIYLSHMGGSVKFGPTFFLPEKGPSSGGRIYLGIPSFFAHGKLASARGQARRKHTKSSRAGASPLSRTVTYKMTHF